MPIKPLFAPFQPFIEERFARAKQSAGEVADAFVLEIHEEPLLKLSRRAEFVVVEPGGPVRITWNGIASLWACAQGAARICRLCHEGRRQRKGRLDLHDHAELKRGLDSLVLAKRFLDHDIPIARAVPEQWPTWAPEIDPAAKRGTDTEKGNQFFLGALGWILRHELAHLTLKHSERELSEGLRSLECERDADEQATKWLRGNLYADSTREAGLRPAEQELELEMRAVAVAIGLIWVAMFEADSHNRGESHPPVAERLDGCFAVLALREDSFAKEILADLIWAWADPQRPEPVRVNNADEALRDALVRLSRMLHDPDQMPWTSDVW